MPQKKVPLQRRIRPSVPVTLEFENSDEKITFELAFDFNVLTRIEEQTGLKTLNVFTVWIQMNATVLSAMFWAAALPNHPEYDSEEGLVTFRSFLDPANSDRVGDALWKAYMLFLDKDRRELMERSRAENMKAAELGERQADPSKPPIATTAAIPTGSSSGPSQDSTSVSALPNSAN